MATGLSDVSFGGRLDIAGDGKLETIDRLHAAAISLFCVTQVVEIYTNYKVLAVIEKTGNSVIPWIDMHKWGTWVVMWQASILSTLVPLIYPWWLHGLPTLLCAVFWFAVGAFPLSVWFRGGWMVGFMKKVHSGEYEAQMRAAAKKQ